MSLTRPEHPMRVAVVAGILLITVNVAIWGGRAQVNGPAATQRPHDLVDLQPAEDQLLLPQGSLGVTLRFGLTGELTVDNTVIPKDQTTIDAVGNEVIVTFEPGPDKVISEFAKGGHRALVRWWPTEISSPEAAAHKHRLSSYTWNFKVG